MLREPPRRRWARPVADAPLDNLLSQGEDVAKGWLLALLEDAPLGEAAAIVAGGIARDGPLICTAALRALRDDGALRELEAGGEYEQLVAGSGGFAGAVGPVAALRAVDALHGVLWSALRRELRDPVPEQVAELAERLATVIELIRGAAVRGQAAGEARPRPNAAAASVETRSPSVESGPPLAQTSGRPDAETSVPPHAETGTAPAGTGASPVEPVGPVPRRPYVVRTPAEPPRPATPPPSPQAAATPEPPATYAQATAAPPPATTPSPSAATHESPAREDALWVAALEDEVARSRRSGAALSLLLVELGESDRLRAAAPGDMSAAFGRFAQAVRSVLRREDLLASESEARVWVIARDTSRIGANALAHRIDRAVRSSDPLGGAPLTVSVGVGVLDEDAEGFDSLIEAAEEAALAAAASGVAVGQAPRHAQ